MSKKVVVFGAGLVAKPLVDYLAGHGFELTVLDIVREKAEALAKPWPNAKGLGFDSSDQAALSNWVKGSDLAVSLLPAVMHPLVAKACLENKVNMVTASYVSPAMQEMAPQIENAGLVFVNEVGVDPGIDHMSAMRVIKHIQKQGGRVEEFYSYCGGLPAPEANTNPWGYKFSWAPRGVLLAARNSAKYQKDGELVEIPSPELFSHYWLVDVEGAGTYEAYPNRDSLSYKEIYGIPDVKTMYRGTLRSISHCDTWLALANLNLFADEPVYHNPGTAAQFLRKHLNIADDACLGCAVRERAGLTRNDITMRKFRWLGMLGDTPIRQENASAIDIMTELMLNKMSFAPAERDLLLMQHEFLAVYPDRKEKTISTLVDYGIPNGDSSMSRLVALPCAVAARFVLEGIITTPGVHRPVKPEIYEPIMQELENLGVKFDEKTTIVKD